MAPPNNEFTAAQVIVSRGEKDEVREQCQQQDANKPVANDWDAPAAQGLYDPQNEHEACGVGFIVSIEGKANHKVREKAWDKLVEIFLQTNLKFSSKKKQMKPCC